MFICVRCKRGVTTEGHFCPFCGAVAPQEGDASDPYIGQTIAQKYFVHQLLGGGGMGQVYKATHLTLDRPVALKILKRSLLADSSLVQRFHREARAASRLNHPNSINVIDFGQTEDGTLFLAMEFLAGRNLMTVIRDDFPIERARMVKILSQILAALTEAHALGILHRDLKPENVMVESRRDESDFVKVLDFGIAQLHEPGDAAAPRLTQAGMVCGTPGYMSPEQTRGDQLDARSDLYSVGVILYELLTGKLPFEADTPLALAAKVLFESPIPAGDRRPDLTMPSDLAALAMRSLSADAGARPASAEEFRRELLACAVPEPHPLHAAELPVAHQGVVLEANQIATRPARRSPPPNKPVSPPAPAVLLAPPAAAVLPALPAAGIVHAGKLRSAPPDANGFIPALSRAPTPRNSAPTPRPRTLAPGREATPLPGRSSAETIDATAGKTAIVDAASFAAADRRPEAPLGPMLRSPLPLVLAATAAVAFLVVLLLVGMRLRAGDGEGQGEAPLAPVAHEDPSATRPTNAPAAPQAPAVTVAAVRPAEPEPRAEAVAQAPAVTVASGPGQPEHRADAAPAGTDKAPPRGSTATTSGHRNRHPASAENGGPAILEVSDTVNSMRVPAASSGEGVLVIVVAPWANVSIDGREIGETPREVLVRSGTYRLRATHPQLGETEGTVTVAAGKRQIWRPVLHE